MDLGSYCKANLVCPGVASIEFEPGTFVQLGVPRALPVNTQLGLIYQALGLKVAEHEVGHLMVPLDFETFQRCIAWTNLCCMCQFLLVNLRQVPDFNASIDSQLTEPY